VGIKFEAFVSDFKPEATAYLEANTAYNEGSVDENSGNVNTCLTWSLIA
jgi:hypothetical protein